MERGETSGANSTVDDIWAKLVPLNSNYSDIELRSNEMTICSEIKISPSEKKEWCKITREKDQVSAIIQNKSSSSILVDDVVVQEDETTIIRCGSELILGPEADGFMSYRFKIMPIKETCKKQLKITMDPEHAKCSICLNVWHDVVTAAPCLHNFCNGCFSEWLKRCQQKHSGILCPQCRAVVQFVGRNHFLHSIEEDILQSDHSLRRSSEELAVLDSYSSIKSPLMVNSQGRGRGGARRGGHRNRRVQGSQRAPAGNARQAVHYQFAGLEVALGMAQEARERQAIELSALRAQVQELAGQVLHYQNQVVPYLQTESEYWQITAKGMEGREDQLLAAIASMGQERDDALSQVQARKAALEASQQSLSEAQHELLHRNNELGQIQQEYQELQAFVGGLIVPDPPQQQLDMEEDPEEDLEEEEPEVAPEENLEEDPAEDLGEVSDGSAFEEEAN